MPVVDPTSAVAGTSITLEQHVDQMNPTEAKPRLAVGKVVFPHFPEALIKTHFRDVLLALQEATMPLRIRWAERWMIPDTLIRVGIWALLREVVVTLALER